jgi:hypothetical protein
MLKYIRVRPVIIKVIYCLMVEQDSAGKAESKLAISRTTLAIIRTTIRNYISSENLTKIVTYVSLLPM